MDTAPAGADAAAHYGFERELGRDAVLRGERGERFHHRLRAAGVENVGFRFGELEADELCDEAAEPETAVVGRAKGLHFGLFELFVERDVHEAPPTVEDGRSDAAGAELAGQEIDRGDAPAAADAESPLSLHPVLDGEAFPEGADEVERIAGLFPG